MYYFKHYIPSLLHLGYHPAYIRIKCNCVDNQVTRVRVYIIRYV